MRVVRFSLSGRTAYGMLDEEKVSELDGEPFESVRQTGMVHDLREVTLLAPALPSKILGVGRNYRVTGDGAGDGTAGDPLVFAKPPSSVVADGAAIVLPADAGRVDFEGELAVVIGRPARDVPRAHAHDVIFGYTIANDVTARGYQHTDGQWTRAKGFDTFCPLGPWIETRLDASDVLVRTDVDGEVRQEGSTARLIHDIPQLIEWLSAVMTLLPGDIILTGTPEGSGPLVAGATVSIHIDGLGTLTNHVEEPTPCTCC